MKTYFILFVSFFLLISTGCAGVANISNFPKSNESLNFEELSKQNFEIDEQAWTRQTKYEYYLEVQILDENVLFAACSEALSKYGYNVSFADLKARTVIGERDLRMHEWNSITGIYYTKKENVFQVFVKNEITQDLTGGPRINRAKEVATALCAGLATCKK